MTKRKGLGVGSVSLILIFAVLCLSIFALLTLSSARSDAGLAERAAQSAKNYYAADTQAESIYVGIVEAIKNGEKPDTVSGTEIFYNGNYISYACPIDERRSICVVFFYDYSRGEAEILQWLETESEGWTADESINVWGGK